MKNYLLIAITALCVSCNRHGSSSGESSLSYGPVQDPPQYGTPYKHVPDRQDVILYQVNIRAFSEEGNLEGVEARLDSIKALGVNVVYLMPTYPVGTLKAKNSPYCVKNYYGINPEFGTLDDLRELVAGAHEKNMAVLMDWIANHTAWDNPWIENKSWYEQDSAGNIIYPPEGWEDVAQLNFDNMEMRQAMIQAMKYWILTANIDGYRCDFTDGPPVDFWKQAIDTLRNIPGHKLLMLAEGQRPENYSAGFDFNFGFKFFYKLEQIFKNGTSVRAIDTLNRIDYEGAAGGQQIIRYTSNHDVNSSDGTPLELFGGRKGSMAAFVIAAYMKSVPMIYSGQEVGTPYRLSFPFTEKNIDWSLNPDMTAEYKKIIAIRNGSSAIRRGELNSFDTGDVCAFTKSLGDETIFVISNLRNRNVQFTLPSGLKNTSWQNEIGEDEMKLHTRLSLQPYSYMVLKKL